MEIWCAYQKIDNAGITGCLAHLHEARVPDCPYKTNEDRLQSEYPCVDYRDITEIDEAIDHLTKEIARVYRVPEKFLRGEGLWIYHL